MPPQSKYFAPQSFKNSNFLSKLPSNPRTAGSGPRKVSRWGGNARNIFIDDLYSPSFGAVSPGSPQKKPRPSLPHSAPALHYHFAGLSPPYRNIPAALHRKTRRTFTTPTHRFRFIRTVLASPTSIAPYLVRRLSPLLCRFTDATVHCTVSASPTLDRRAEHFIDLPTCASSIAQDLLPRRRHPPQPHHPLLIRRHP